MASIKYNATLFGTMTKLRIEIKLLEYQIRSKKKLMGVEIYEAMATGNHKGAEDIFMSCKRNVDDLSHTLRLKVDEFEMLRDDGESDSIKKPGSSRNNADEEDEETEAPVEEEE
mmetsp:Transcript_11639/g.14034  ORF Transcript_11639/g.14034 Transcript_11639/m.14034 type:complete len:114 (+) Transcript_11639:77-418(+)